MKYAFSVYILTVQSYENDTITRFDDAFVSRDEAERYGKNYVKNAHKAKIYSVTEQKVYRASGEHVDEPEF